MKNVANYISVSRIIMSIILFFTEILSITFYTVYVYCGIPNIIEDLSEKIFPKGDK